MDAFFVPSENSVVLKNGEGVNIAVYLFPFIDMAVLAVIVLAVSLIARILGVHDMLPGIAAVIALMFVHIIAFQIGLSPIYKRFRRLRRSMLIRHGSDITILSCVPDKKVVSESSFSLRSLARIEREIQIQHFATNYMKQNYFSNDRVGGESDIYATEYSGVHLLKERKQYYIFTGIDKKNGKKKKFKIYKAYTDIYKITDGL